MRSAKPVSVTKLLEEISSKSGRRPSEAFQAFVLLAALCQRCHNRLDAPMRRENAARTRASKQAVTA